MSAPDGEPTGVAGSVSSAGAAGFAGATNLAGAPSFAGALSAQAGTGDAVDDAGAPVGSVTSSGTVSTLCDLQVTPEEGSNLPIGRFDADHGNGVSTNGVAYPQQHAFEASTVVPEYGYLVLNLTFNGEWPSVGANYALDPIAPNAQTSVLFTLGDSGLKRSWAGAPGSVITVRGIRQTVLPASYLYTEVTFELNNVEFQPSTLPGDNGAIGNFKLSGLCDGNFSDFTGVR